MPCYIRASLEVPDAFPLHAAAAVVVVAVVETLRQCTAGHRTEHRSKIEIETFCLSTARRHHLSGYRTEGSLSPTGPHRTHTSPEGTHRPRAPRDTLAEKEKRKARVLTCTRSRSSRRGCVLRRRKQVFCCWEVARRRTGLDGGIRPRWWRPLEPLALLPALLRSSWFGVLLGLRLILAVKASSDLRRVLRGFEEILVSRLPGCVRLPMRVKNCDNHSRADQAVKQWSIYTEQ